ncbi:MAG: hypothetical protein U0T84_08215 [Chitinophagales bacterium]
MEKALRALVKALLNLQPFQKVFKIIYWEYEAFISRKFATKIAPDLSVKDGVFKGMKYPGLEAAGSALVPKFVGSYEDELNDIISSSYDFIVDIGCAEGYYAVGLAMRNPTAKVIAYDTDEYAQSLCLAMAKANGVSDRVEIKSSCTSQDLAQMVYPRKTLVISDCEGYEFELFTPATALALKNSTILIEVHPINGKDKESLLNIFIATHRHSIISSQLKSASDYVAFNGLERTFINDLLLFERNTRQEWLILTPIS